MSKHDIIDPVGVGLNLLAKLRGRWLVVGSIRVGERVAFFFAVVKVEMEVPGAY